MRKIFEMSLFLSAMSLASGAYAQQSASGEVSEWGKVEKEMSEAAHALSDATVDTSKKAWKATKEGSSEAWDATKEGSVEAWDATKDGSQNAWNATKEGSQEAWSATSEKSKTTWEKGKKKVHEATAPD